MKLIYIDPHCYGIQITDCKALSEVDGILKDARGVEGAWDGECIYWIFVAKDGEVTKGEWDLT